MPQGGPAGRAQCVVLITGQLRQEDLQSALTKIVERHEILRTTYRLLPGMALPLQVVAEEGVAAWCNLDLRREREARAPEAEIEAFIREERQRPFDFEQGPLLEASLVALAADEHLY